MNKKREPSSAAGAPASISYEAAFEQDLAGMTVAEFIRWNPRFTEEEARARIAVAKAKVSRMKHTEPNPGVVDTRDLSSAGTAEELSRQARQTLERGQADIASRTPAQQLEHENELLAALLAEAGEKHP